MEVGASGVPGQHVLQVVVAGNRAGPDLAITLLHLMEVPTAKVLDKIHKLVTHKVVLLVMPNTFCIK